MYESFEPWHLRDDYKVKKVHAHSPPLSFFFWGGGGVASLSMSSFCNITMTRWIDFITKAGLSQLEFPLL